MSLSRTLVGWSLPGVRLRSHEARLPGPFMKPVEGVSGRLILGSSSSSDQTSDVHLHLRSGHKAHDSHGCLKAVMCRKLI